MRRWAKNIRYCLNRYVLLPYIFFLVTSNTAAAQCPANIDFETGTFNGWQSWTGSVDEIQAQNKITLNPTTADGVNQIMLSLNPGDGLDKYGQFPRNCPNGSGHSIQLGNDMNGHLAEGISYSLTIPPTANKYKLLLNYALVLQNPTHGPTQNPRFEIEVMNQTDDIILPCPSLNLVAGSIAGLQSSGILFNGSMVYYRDWSGLSINLDNLAGKNIRVFFKTAGCTFIDHFCYAYLDINSNCNGSFESSVFCASDTAVNLKAPFGFKNYTWYNTNFSQVLGTQQILHLSPLPINGTAISVELVPFDGYGCTDTLTAQFSDTLTIKANAGPDFTSCNAAPTQIGTVPLPGRTYSWTPTSYLDNPTISNPIATPNVTTEYILTVNSEGGGCTSKDTVKVFAKTVDDKVNVVGNTSYCIGFGQQPLLRVSLSDSIQWFKDSTAIAGATQLQYAVMQSGKYYAQIFNKGCPLPFGTKETAFLIDTPTPGITYPTIDAAFNFPEPLHARQFGNAVLWTPATSLNDPYSYTPTFSGLSQQLYTVQIKTATGCVIVDTQLVKTHKKIAIYVPTAFTPDGNGVNDRLKPILIGFTKINYFKIYNRWGQLLFATTNDQAGWDGKTNNIPVEMQAVVWVIEAVDVDGVVHSKKGTTVLYR